jgi:ATP-dependent exoDNAse (exonuclease V) beta subunit
MTHPRINTVVAAAGAGKTTRIVADITEEVKRRDPEEIVATTFTIKAADELIERSRASLFKAGQADSAARLLGARFGTVNAICGQIVAEHALDLGRSPRAEVIPDTSIAQLFAIAANIAIERHAPVLNSLADAMGASEPKQAHDAERSDWRTKLRRLIELARANGLGPEGLKDSAKRSVETFLPLLPAAPGVQAKHLDAALAEAVKLAAAAIPENASKTAEDSITLLTRVQNSLQRGETLSWPDWARLTKLKCAKKDGTAFVDALDAVARAAGRNPEHPRLREQCEAFIRTLFDCAAEALEAYQDYKSSRGLLDFIDQEALALEVLRDPQMSARLGERISRVFVDEFQDSSPLQIAIFTAMAELVEASTWVGDPKQAIYGFRNADSSLTQAAFAGVASTSTAPQGVLATSYRSRADIIGFVNAAFGPAFEAMGLPAETHAFKDTSRKEAGFDHAPFSVWWLDGKLETQFAALAASIRDTVACGDDWKVDARDGSLRPLEAGDVAVLCRTRSDIAKMAYALNQLGVKVAVEREGLGATPHVELVMAAYRWVADPSDRLALAELARFFSDDPASDLWLKAVSDPDQAAALAAAVPISAELTDLRSRILNLTPAEILDGVICMPEVARRLESWGDSAARLDDLEALRGFARSYESNCASTGVPATPSGLVLALDAREPPRPKSLQADAVKVMTYHGAKGLEWPLVVLTGLHKEPTARLFEPVAEAMGELDWLDPLAGRWIRYWPWPYGSQSKDVALDEAALTSDLGQLAARRAREEETRLLYVGVTRARDYVVLAPQSKGDLKWLQVLDGDQPGHVTLPTGAENTIRVGDAVFPARLSTAAVDDQVVAQAPTPTFGRVERPAVPRPPLRRRPSGEISSDRYMVAERVQLGPRLPIVGSPDMRNLGEAVHAIFAADRADQTPAVRCQRAEAVLERWGVHQVKAQDVLDACDRLNAHLDGLWPTGLLHRETPVFARLGDQLVSGRIDLLAEHDTGYAIIDHKSFPGSRDAWDARAVEYGPQLGLYAQALEAATNRPCDALYIHMPIVGALLRVARQP